MSSTTTTEFYGLTQYVGSDKPSFTDNNEAFRNIDGDLHTAVVGVGDNSEAIVGIRATVASLRESVVTLQSDLGTEKGKIVALQSKETLQDAEIADVKADAQDMITAYKEASATSTHNYVDGDFFIYNDVLYKATDTIAIGDTIVPDTNCTTDNVTTELLAINTALPKLVKTVTADGVKTIAELLNELAVGVSNVKNGATLVLTVDTAPNNPSVHIYTGNTSVGYAFSNFSYTSITTVHLTTNSSARHRVTLADGQYPSVIDQSSTVYGVGTKLELYN